MKRLLTVAAASCVAFVAAQTHAGDAANHSPISKRDMIAGISGCMKKRMSTDKNISYNEAKRICKNQMDGKDGNSAASALVASDTLPKP